tara:strand:- start:6470 stop:6979 length:510 start_codon:yes stop_codon:yes gene_type:complete
MDQIIINWGKYINMSFVGDILGGYGARQLGDYNERLYAKKSEINTRNAEIKKKTFEEVDLPRILKDQERNKSNQFVNLIKSGIDVDKIGETAYLIQLEQNIEDAFEVSIATYNSTLDYEQQLNNSLIIQAQGQAEAYKGKVTERAAYAKAAGTMFSNYQSSGGESILTG